MKCLKQNTWKLFLHSICSQITGPWSKASNLCGKKIYNQPTSGHQGQNSGHPGQNPSIVPGGSKWGQGQCREVHDLRNPPALISGLLSQTFPNRLCKNLRESLYQRKIKQNNKLSCNIWNINYLFLQFNKCIGNWVNFPTLSHCCMSHAISVWMLLSLMYLYSL